MKDARDLPQALKVLYRTLPLQRRRQGFVTLFLMLIGGAAEMLGISAVLVFLTLLTKPNGLASTRIWHSVQPWLPANADPLLVTTGAFILVTLISGAIRLALIWQSSSIAINAGVDLAAAAFKRVTSQRYKFYLDTGSDEILARIEKILIINNVILVGVQAVVSSTVALAIIIFLLFLDFRIAITLGLIVVGSYLIISFVSRSTLSSNSEIIAGAHLERIKRVQQAVGGIRDILIDRSQPVFQHDFERSGNRARRPLVINSFIPNAPRIIIEVIGMFAIAVLALVLSRREGGLIAALPLLAGLAIGAQRLLPLFQQSYLGWSAFLANRQALLEVAGLLSLDEHNLAVVPGMRRPFEAAVEFDNVSFAYVGDRYVLKGLSFAIQRGERIGIVGTTGSGKSTLTDLLLGLLEPTIGHILVDGTELDAATMPGWQSQVAHVPQSIYLSDDSIAANIAFGVDAGEIDHALVAQAAHDAGIDDFVASLPEGYEARCGERGIRLSGGQRQRIGIARALYKRASILILDEATSALDNATEKAVMESISALASDITIVMIAHRLTSLTECGRILHVEGGRVTAIPHGSVGTEPVAARRP